MITESFPDKLLNGLLGNLTKFFLDRLIGRKDPYLPLLELLNEFSSQELGHPPVHRFCMSSGLYDDFSIVLWQPFEPVSIHQQKGHIPSVSGDGSIFNDLVEFKHKHCGGDLKSVYHTGLRC